MRALPVLLLLALIPLTRSTAAVSASGTGWIGVPANAPAASRPPNSTAAVPQTVAVPDSFVIGLPSRAVGPGIVLPTLSGIARLVFATESGDLVLVGARSGASARTIPLGAVPLGGLAAAYLGADLGNGIFVATIDGRIHGFHDDGTPLAGWPVTASGFSSTASTLAALGNLDDDQELEVVWAGSDGMLWAWRADGSLVAGFPTQVGDAGTPIRIALSDLDGAAGVEIVATSENGQVYALGGHGETLPGWPVMAWATPPFHPVVAYVPPHPNIIVASTNGGIRVHRPNGEQRWAGTAQNPTQQFIAGDLDQDGYDEIVFSNSANYYLLSPLGRTLTLHDFGVRFVNEWLIGSLTTDGAPALLQVVPPGVLTLRDRSGNAFGLAMAPGGEAPLASIADVDADGKTDIVAAGSDSALHVYRTGVTLISAAQIWPTARGNYARTGSRVYTPTLDRTDDLPPDPIVDLAAGDVAGHAVELLWTSPADVGALGRASGYELRRARTPIDEASFAAADPVENVPTPAEPGSFERFVTRGLDESTTYYFALRSTDRGGNRSPISNPVVVETAALPPDPVTDLRIASASDTSLTLIWTATGDDGSSGRPLHYTIRAAEEPMNEARFAASPIGRVVPASSDAGGAETVTLGGLMRGHRYWVALRAEDDAGNVTPISNPVSRTSGPLAGRAGVALASGAQPARVPVEVFWQSGLDAGVSPARLRIHDISGRVVRTLDVGDGAAGVARWDGRDGDGHTVPAGLYFARFVSGSASARARIVLLR